MPRIGFSPATKGSYLKEIEVPADEFGRPNADPPNIVDQDNITLYSFTVGTDRLTYKWEIPTDYAGGDIDFVIHWTNDGGVDDNGKNVKWQLDYQIVEEGDPVSGNHGNSPKTVEDSYASDSGWIEYHTAAMTIVAADFAAKHHMLLKLSAITPDGTILTAEPHLICMCITYRAKWGRKP